MTIPFRSGALTALILSAAVSSALPASAGCYEGLGCSDQTTFPISALRNGAGCPLLWQIRNEIYHERGLCFRTERARAAFGNENCRYDDPNSAPLNRYERANVGAIVRVEREMGCPR